MSIRDEAERLLYESGLMRILETYGRAYPVGSYLYDLMAWEDLDISIECENPTEEMLYRFSHCVNQLLNPYRFEAGMKGKNAMFYSCETKIYDRRWNIDIWFRDRESVAATLEHCQMLEQRVKNEPDQRKKIMDFKEALISMDLYGMDKNPIRHYHSGDIYRAVLEDDVKDVEEFLKRYPLHET